METIDRVQSLADLHQMAGPANVYVLGIRGSLSVPRTET